MPNEMGNLRRWLHKDFFRYKLLVGTQSKNTKGPEPFRNRIAYAMRQASRAGKVDLEPASFLLDPWANQPGKYPGGQCGHGLSKVNVNGRVLLSVPRQSTTIADQM